eukprot:359790-Pelagomonas_calceolata.AAC.1
MWASLLREHVGSQEQRKWHAFHLGVHGQTYHVQMYVPVKVNSQLSRLAVKRFDWRPYLSCDL